ncbi:MAG: glutamine synthetase III [Eubacteriales bacterium]|nr:glutamine synthetase III [Eubacteriales bacterium]
MSKVTEYFGSKVFNDAVMRERLPKETYKAIQRTIKDGKRLDSETATVVASVMKDWAVENGATHFTHWFQPMTGVTAEKHDSFISPAADGRAIMEFSGKELIKGEPDASSFPSGGLRATFEARGYTAWDATSYAFIKEDVLCIPTVFISYSGEALDQKTALLRSMEAINKQSLRVLRLFGNTDVRSVKSNVGPEQEYFLITKEMYDRRKDLIYTGRTLYGARPPKGQELDDHYFGTIKARVADFMKEVDTELWKMGVLSKTEHNEVAPAQHEVACIYNTSNISCDHNQITMEVLQKVAKKHGLVCLLHEKPFAGVNGSGKHNNWSISTDTGMNLLEPGDTPYENAQFLLFLCAVIKAVDEYQDLLRISVSSAANDNRLGGNEAPPAIMSMFIGSDLSEILEAIENDEPFDSKEKDIIKVGVHTIPKFSKDATDRNRTSPFAFTGNKFEFRMPGSNVSLSCANTVINTAVAQVLMEFADELERAEDFEKSLHELIQKTYREHKRIIFNGDGYDDSWVKEAESRGLLNLKNTPEALPHLLDPKNIKLYETHGVYSETELRARYHVLMENYCKVLNIEALTMLDMANKDILPAMSKYTTVLAQACTEKSIVAANIDRVYEKETLRKLTATMTAMYKQSRKLEKDLLDAKSISDITELGSFYKDVILQDMKELRIPADEMEMIASSEYWPYPSYGEMLFSVR